jgi:endonuclease/exonuclease/phosphatase family metal-dependent hydrolase
MWKSVKSVAMMLLLPLAIVLVILAGLSLQVPQYWNAWTQAGYAQPLPLLEEAKKHVTSCQSQPIKVLSYNIRYGSDWMEAMGERFNRPDSGYQPWSMRHPEIKARISQYAPDLIGLQETHTEADIRHIVSLQDFRVLSYRNGDFSYGDSALLYRANRFNALDYGQLWLSPSPDLPMSLGFKPLAMVRYVNWALLQEKSTGFQFMFVNTHFDNNSANKEPSASLFNQRITALTQGYPMIVTGDFNSKATTTRYQQVLGNPATGPGLVNLYDKVDPAQNWDKPHPNNLIDHILAGGPCAIAVNEWAVDKTPSTTGEPLSDHDPILARMQFTGWK